MASNVFKQLYENSKLLVSPSAGEEVPTLKRELPQIDSETKLLSKAHKAEQEHHAKAHYFLAQNGIKIQDVSQNLDAINAATTFERTERIQSTDVEKFLREEHERIIISTVEESRRHTHDDFEDTVDRVMDAEWRNTQRHILEEWDHYQDNKAAAKTKAQEEHMTQYARVIMGLNDARLQRKDFAVINAFGKLSLPVEQNRSSEKAINAWQLLNTLVGESDATGDERRQGYFIRKYLEQPQNSVAAVEARQSLLAASRAWLEKQYMQYVDDVLLKNAAEAKIGGIPSIAHRIRAFMNIEFKKNSRWTDPNLEIVEETPIWTFTYLLLRSGHADLALDYVLNNRNLFQSEPSFVGYFEEYMSSPERRLSKSARTAILADYQRLEYGSQKADRYKLLLFKIIGRCEMNKKSLPEDVKITEDFIWLQLLLVRERTQTEEFEHERYHLSDLQNLFVRFGSARFDPNSVSPWTYFKILLLTLQFERAVNYLYKHEKTRLEAVHFAIALVYYGLLRIPAQPLTASIDLLILEDDSRVSLNFTRLIYQYIRLFSTSNPRQALQYLFLLTLYSDCREATGCDMTSVCYMYIRDLLLTSKEFKALLGSKTSEYNREPGYIDHYKDLLGISNENEYAQALLMPIAEKCELEGRYVEAVAVYELTWDYNKVIDILNKELGDALQQQAVERAATPQETAKDEVINFARTTLERYERQQHIGAIIHDSKKYTTRLLIQFLRARKLYEEGLYEQSLQLVYQTGVIPLHDNMIQVQQAADNFAHLENTISKSIPDLLVMVMDMLYKLWRTYTLSRVNLGASAHQTIASLEEHVRALLSFVGTIQFKIPADTITKLNRAEMMMTSDIQRALP
ncbi:hypothetical protein EC973_005635 [Apophysomyces ossiformis]|uniref:Nuclear pore protein n=1 Tax=Apophysomyces ossiformis TaxID=679940 RepID=A0A8H7EKZ1_9FUNG|nr:hypothetical protein EC973_005635 [Apophysomyces ossiformis]